MVIGVGFEGRGEERGIPSTGNRNPGGFEGVDLRRIEDSEIRCSEMGESLLKKKKRGKGKGYGHGEATDTSLIPEGFDESGTARN